MQGFNMGRYVPPDQEGIVSGNRLLGNRAQKANAAGVPVVRFEMPFAVWCDGCEERTIGRDGKTHPVLIGQGVRFNAEKHKTGNYYSTPIFTFRMRHPACGKYIAIRTDPASTSYIVVEGGRRRREYSDDADEGGEFLDPASAAARSAAALAGVEGGDAAHGSSSELDRLDAFDRLERTIVHRAPAAPGSASDPAQGGPISGLDAARRLEALTRSNARQWDDPYERNRALRAAFRVGRHAREQAAADDEGLRKRLGGLSEDLHLLPATEADARHAALIDFGSKPTGSETPSAVADRRTLAQPLFGNKGGAADAKKQPRDRISSASGGLALVKSASLSALPSSASPARASSRNRTYAPTTEAAKRQRSIRDHLASTVLANTRLTTDPFVAALAGGSQSDAEKTKPPIKGLKGLRKSATVADLRQRAETDSKTVTMTTTPESQPPRLGAKRKRGVEDEEEKDAESKPSKLAAALVSYDSD
ncbi:hypothetical protein SPBR_00593 [Sporothrix brasiliensis 5110]|uniref:Coiled-coil domain-containing protein 130 n=1 Tax=Sporothrix brasiliensis 5110 TaxID=1398154 RepID=A0A0C2ITW5_9PEZI|nr:uncharacterized protein SPBR_00593 [Sporothrix brasiliensis 5110]KIH90220.1 hypothetical protein SPBR_00593 [Sporothrix brasiliensis 5110]